MLRFKNGEVEQYGRIVEAFQQPMYRYCSRLLGSGAEAEDAVQEILVKAYQKYRQVSSAGQLLFMAV
ncbi:RNA polymerase sigma factor [Paenibacillus rhizoplanae]